MSRKALAKKKPEFEEYLKWFSSLTYEKGTEITDKVGAQIQLHHDSNNEVIKKALTRTFSLESWCTYPPSESPEFKWPKQRKQRMKEYQNFFDMADTYEIPIHVGAWHEGEYAFLYLGNQESGIIVLRPERVLEYIQPEEYETKTIAQIRKELSGTETASAGEVSMIPAGEQNTLTKKAVSDEIEATSKQIASFGDFDKIVERCNERVHRGDYILTVQRLIPEHSRSFGSYSWPALNRPYENSRGRGEANRTHDCVAQDRTIYRINLVEYDDPIAMIRYRVPTETDPEKWSVRTTQAYYWPDVLEMNPDAQIVERYEYRKKHVFISLKKSDAWRYDSLTGKTPRANFELFSNEYINLTYMNSVWLKAIITSKNLGNWRIGGREVNYNYAIQYLNTALDYVLKREKIEKEMIDKMNRKVCEDSEWPVKLSEWKLANDVRIMSPYQVKRFVKAMSNK